MRRLDLVAGLVVTLVPSGDATRADRETDPAVRAACSGRDTRGAATLSHGDPSLMTMREECKTGHTVA